MAARREAAALAASTARVTNARGRIVRVAAQAALLCERYGSMITPIDVPPVPTATDSPSMESHADRLEQEALRAENRFLDEQTEARTASFLQAISGIGGQTDASALDLRRMSDGVEQGSRGGDTGGDAADDVRADVLRIVGRLRQDAAMEAVERARTAAEVICSETDLDKATLLVSNLRSLVDSTNAAAAASEMRAGRIDALLVAIADVKGSAADSLRLLLERERGGELELPVLDRRADDLRKSAEEEAAALRRIADRDRVASLTAETLENLGYVVEEGFASALIGTGAAIATRPEWDGYGVRVRMDAGSGHLRTHLVRDATQPSTAARELAVEKELCSDGERFRERMAGAGVELAEPIIEPPGAVRPATVQLGNLAFTDGQKTKTRQRARTT
ncbi:MAG: hypothetical protein ACKVUT_18370 [Gaiella sp.]